MSYTHCLIHSLSFYKHQPPLMKVFLIFFILKSLTSNLWDNKVKGILNICTNSTDMNSPWGSVVSSYLWWFYQYFTHSTYCPGWLSTPVNPSNQEAAYLESGLRPKVHTEKEDLSHFCWGAHCLNSHTKQEQGIAVMPEGAKSCGSTGGSLIGRSGVRNDFSKKVTDKNRAQRSVCR